MKTILTTLGVAVLLAVITALAVIYSGLFNVGATVSDAAPLKWMFITTRENSIKHHAKSVTGSAPKGVEAVEHGFRSFRETCAVCHTPPGRSVSTIAKGLNPPAPALAELVDMETPELFWVTKNGIRFTGMPAWGGSYSDGEIWQMVAFLRTTPQMQAADYDALDRRVSQPPTK